MCSQCKKTVRGCDFTSARTRSEFSPSDVVTLTLIPNHNPDHKD